MPRTNFGALLGGYREKRLITRHSQTARKNVGLVFPPCPGRSAEPFVGLRAAPVQEEWERPRITNPTFHCV